jgi:hypothetical protein
MGGGQQYLENLPLVLFGRPSGNPPLAVRSLWGGPEMSGPDWDQIGFRVVMATSIVAVGALVVAMYLVWPLGTLVLAGAFCLVYAGLSLAGAGRAIPPAYTEWIGKQIIGLCGLKLSA